MNIENQSQLQEHDHLKVLVGILRGYRTTLINSENDLFIESIVDFIDPTDDQKSEFKQLLSNTKYTSTLTESGIGLNRNLISETSNRLGHKIFPPSPDPTELRTYINLIFNKSDDFEWVCAIPDVYWAQFFHKLLGEGSPIINRYIRKEVINSIQVLAQRAAALGIEPEIVSQLPIIDDWDSPFLGLNREVIHYVEAMMLKANYSSEDRTNDYRQILIMIRQCKEQISELDRHKENYGISIRMTYSIHRLGQSLNRLQQLLHLLETSISEELFLKMVPLFKNIIKSENTRFSIARYFKDNVQVLSYRVVENTSKVGEKYITGTEKEYWSLFRKAIGGGLIVSLLCAFKSRIYFAQFPIFWEAFFYSMNYAIGFVIIHLLHFTLATKQPAMTASTIAANLSNNGENPDWLNDTTNLLVKLIRSQFIALLGNALIAFPVAYCIDQIYYFINGHHIVNIAKAHSMITELNLVQSLAVFHAAIAGVYLMFSGLISGYYENNWLYSNMTDRLANQPFLLKVLGKKRLQKVANILEKNIGGIAGNIVLGVFLGATSAIGFTIGLPLDIRHITFSSGNFGIALSSLNNQIPTDAWVNSIIGIGAIGIINVIVSFGLSILFALNSRSTKFSEAKRLFANLAWKFVHHSLSFFYPVKEKEVKKGNDTL